MPSCIHCGCTDARACRTPDGPCSWASLNPPVCSACVEIEAGDAADQAGEDGMLCPASPVPAPHLPLFLSETDCYCARCRMSLVAA